MKQPSYERAYAGVAAFATTAPKKSLRLALASATSFLEAGPNTLFVSFDFETIYYA